MVRCPATGRELSTGVAMDAVTFKPLPEIRSQIKCPFADLIMIGQRARLGWGVRLHPPQRFPGYSLTI
jgi:hypothetical protein